MQSHRSIIALLSVLAAIFSSFAQAQKVIHLSALADGRLLLDGKAITLPELDRAFKKLKEENGVVLYYRENGQQEPTPQAMSAIKLLIEHALPVSLSSKADFSDHVDASGKSNPRQRP